jgi:hypothetical protein
MSYGLAVVGVEDVVAVAARERVRAWPAGDRVAAAAGADHVFAVAAVDHVWAVLASMRSLSGPPMIESGSELPRRSTSSPSPPVIGQRAEEVQARAALAAAVDESVTPAEPDGSRAPPRAQAGVAQRESRFGERRGGGAGHRGGVGADVDIVSSHATRAREGDPVEATP